MNIHQALKEKNRLAGKLKTLDTKILANARWVKGNEPTYELRELLAERIRTVSDLNSLKTRISIATQPVLDKIFEMAENKAYVQILRSMDLSKGLEYDRYGRNAIAVEYDTAMPIKERDEHIENFEKRIGDLQDALDKFNATTEVI